jgi:hypothetical protein
VILRETVDGNEASFDDAMRINSCIRLCWLTRMANTYTGSHLYGARSVSLGERAAAAPYQLQSCNNSHNGNRRP